MKVSAKYKKIFKKNKRLFDQGKISVLESAENMQTLHDIVESRKENIERAMKNLAR